MEITKEADRIQEAIRLHGLWLMGDPTGVQANLSGANLSYANLRNANLSGANLSYANLSYANLRNANLRNANLRNANLSGANLSGADLSYANLRNANLSYANLSGANLSGANLSGADLSGADLSGAEIDSLTSAQTKILPDDGDVIGWKKLAGGKLARLLIASETPRSNATGRKCRAKSATVLDVWGADGIPVKEGHSGRSFDFRYVVGEVVECDKWNENRWEECTGGIHFFITRVEAEKYQV